MLTDAFFGLLRYAAPVGLASMGESVGQKAGVINIGLEGIMVTSAFCATVACDLTKDPWIGLGLGVLAGFVLALVQAFFTLRLGCDQVVVGTAVNLFGLGLTGTLYRLKYGSSGQLLSVAKVPQFGGCDVVLVAWLASVVVVTWLVFRSKWGLVARATGEYPPAVVANGFSPIWTRFQAVMVGGLFAGLAGAYLSLGIAGSFAENMTAGRGFVALAMVTFGRWKPIGVFLASLLVGYVDSLQFELQTKNIGWPPQFFIALPYVVVLVVLVFAGKGSAAPAALARPFDRKG